MLTVISDLVKFHVYSFIVFKCLMKPDIVRNYDFARCGLRLRHVTCYHGGHKNGITMTIMRLLCYTMMLYLHAYCFTNFIATYYHLLLRIKICTMLKMNHKYSTNWSQLARTFRLSNVWVRLANTYVLTHLFLLFFFVLLANCECLRQVPEFLVWFFLGWFLVTRAGKVLDISSIENKSF